MSLLGWQRSLFRGSRPLETLMIRRILQLLFLPLFIPLRFIYADILRMQSATILYAWYRNQKEYDDLSKDDETQGIHKNWKEWLEDAEAMEAGCKAKKQNFIKVIIRPEPLRRWLKANQLTNDADNREFYIDHVYKAACKQGIELHGQRRGKS